MNILLSQCYYFMFIISVLLFQVYYLKVTIPTSFIILFLSGCVIICAIDIINIDEVYDS